MDGSRYPWQPGMLLFSSCPCTHLFWRTIGLKGLTCLCLDFNDDLIEDPPSTLRAYAFSRRCSRMDYRIETRALMFLKISNNIYVRKHAISYHELWSLHIAATCNAGVISNIISFQVFHSFTAPTAPTQRCQPGQPQLNDFQPRTTFVANLGQSKMNTLANNLRSK